MNVRLVVTGQTKDGKSVFASDEEVDPVTVAVSPGAEFHRLWGSDTPAKLPTDGTPPQQPTFFPPAEGFRFLYFAVPPGETRPASDIDLTKALAEFEEKLPGAAAHMEPDNPGMHTTDTIDFGVMLSGEVVLELDDGAEKTLKPGDAYIQNGTRHRWSNRGAEQAVLAVVIIGAKRA